MQFLGMLEACGNKILFRVFNSDIELKDIKRALHWLYKYSIDKLSKMSHLRAKNKHFLPYVVFLRHFRTT